MLRVFISAAVIVVAAVPAVALGGGAPPGATAKCRDGTYSYSKHHSGTCSHHGGVAQWLDGTGAPTKKKTTPPAGSGGAIALGRTVLLARRTRTSGCLLGVKPDPHCSPGAYYSGLTNSVICASRFRTSSIRNVPTSEKHAVEIEYGLTAKAYGSTLEIDHIVSLELGGSNDAANLYPEKAPGFHVKDKLENRLHAMVCAGQITLATAQRRIAGDWVALYASVFGEAPTL